MEVKARLFLKLGFTLLLFLISLYIGFKTIEKENTIDAPIIFSMEELGYKDSKPLGSFVDVDYVNGKEYEFYYLYVNSETEDFLKMYLYECENVTVARNLFETILIQKKESMLKNSCIGDCYIGKITFEDAIKDWMELKDWNVDIGYSSFDYHTEVSETMGWYDVVLSKGNYVLILDVDSDILMNKENINVLVSIFDRVEVLDN